MITFDAKKTWERHARRVMNTLARALKGNGFGVSPVRFNAGGIAVWGEVSFWARRVYANHGVYACAYHEDVIRDEATLLYRAEEWPEHLGGGPGHKHMGTNRWLPLGVDLPVDLVQLIDRPDFREEP